ncbi:MAG: hypothetical protein WCD89_11845 [Anaerocolumna sp.]
MKITKKLVFILSAAVVIIFAVSYILKFDLGLFYLPKSYVLLSLENTLEEEWRGIQAVYKSTYGMSVTTFKEEKEVLSLTAYNDKNKIIFSCPRFFDNNYIGFTKHISSPNKKGSVKNTDKSSKKKEKILSLTEIYKKYAKVSKKGNKSFAVTNGKDSVYETDEFEVVLNKNIIELLPDYIKKYIADETVSERIKTYLNKLDSDIIIDIYIDDSNKIRSMNLSYSYSGQDAFAEITFNDAGSYWDDISLTYISGENDKTTVTIKSKGNHSREENIYTDETNLIVLSGAMTTVQLKSSTSIDFSKQNDNVSYKLKGDIYSSPINMEAVGDLDTGTGTIQMDINLKLLFDEYLLKINMDEDENNLKDIDTFQSIGSLYNKQCNSIMDCLKKILQ